jgi:predicted nuclease of predicted toxin-antitoxin system
MRLLLDMNLSPDWVPLLHERGVEAVHWSTIGSYKAPKCGDHAWARDNDCVVFTHDLDFGMLLAHSKDSRPSVIQVRHP